MLHRRMHQRHCLNPRPPLVERNVLLYKARGCPSQKTSAIKEGFQLPWMPAPILCR
jgi:hypothetical protein